MDTILFDNENEKSLYILK